MRRIPPSITMKEANSTPLQTGTPGGHPKEADNKPRRIRYPCTPFPPASDFNDDQAHDHHDSRQPGWQHAAQVDRELSFSTQSKE